MPRAPSYVFNCSAALRGGGGSRGAGRGPWAASSVCPPLGLRRCRGGVRSRRGSEGVKGASEHYLRGHRVGGSVAAVASL